MESMEEDDHEAPSALSSESIQKKKASSNSTTVELQTLEEKTDFWQEMVGQVRRHRLSQGLPGTYTP